MLWLDTWVRRRRERAYREAWDYTERLDQLAKHDLEGYYRAVQAGTLEQLLEQAAPTPPPAPAHREG